MRVLITGASGMLGQELVKAFAGHDLLLTDVGELDITDGAGVDAYCCLHRPELILNAAAYTNVDGCETPEGKELAMKINGRGPGNLARSAEALGATLVHISTDYVFDGALDRPYRIDDPTDPINGYGESKWVGEEEVRRHSTKHFIFRTAWLYGASGKNFVSTMLALAETHQELTVVSDQFGSPTYAKDLAEAILTISGGNRYGTYHLTNAGYCSWYDLAVEAFAQAGKKVLVRPVPSSAYPRPAARPVNSRLDGSKLIQEGYSLLRPWQEALRDYLIEIGGIGENR